MLLLCPAAVPGAGGGGEGEVPEGVPVDGGEGLQGGLFGLSFMTRAEDGLRTLRQARREAARRGVRVGGTIDGAGPYSFQRKRPEVRS